MVNHHGHLWSLRHGICAHLVKTDGIQVEAEVTEDNIADVAHGQGEELVCRELLGSEES